MNGNIELLVKEAFQPDFGLGLARIDEHTMKTLNVDIGDTIEILGQKKTAATVCGWHHSDEGAGVIRLDELQKVNAGVDTNAMVKKVYDLKVAGEVVLAPMPLKGQRIEFKAGIGDILRKGLLGHPLTPEDRVVVKGLVFNGKMVQFEVIKPLKGIFCIGNETKIGLEPAK